MKAFLFLNRICRGYSGIINGIYRFLLKNLLFKQVGFFIDKLLSKSLSSQRVRLIPVVYKNSDLRIPVLPNQWDTGNRLSRF